MPCSVHIYYVDNQSSALGNDDFDRRPALLQKLPVSCQRSIMKKKNKADTDAALLSLLIQHWLPSYVRNVDFSEVTISHTNKGKPFYASPPSICDLQYNVSRSSGGIFIAVRTDGVPIGVDAITISQQWTREVIEGFSSLFTKKEMNEILSDTGPHMFLEFWALKEAFVKATGEGLSDDVARVEFSRHPNNQREYLVSIDNELSEWRAKVLEFRSCIVAVISKDAMTVEVELAETFENYSRTLSVEDS